MNFATLTNIATMFFCTAVLLQSVRLMHLLRAVKSGGFDTVVSSVDSATGRAHAVLCELKLVLAQCAATTGIVDEGRELTEELGIMIGIGNATAERLIDAGRSANRAPDHADQFAVEVVAA